jgi:hypothetical protein
VRERESKMMIEDQNLRTRERKREKRERERENERKREREKLRYETGKTRGGGERGGGKNDQCKMVCLKHKTVRNSQTLDEVRPQLSKQNKIHFYNFSSTLKLKVFYT